jgi:hypothetical protein
VFGVEPAPVLPAVPVLVVEPAVVVPPLAEPLLVEVLLVAPLPAAVPAPAVVPVLVATPLVAEPLLVEALLVAPVPAAVPVPVVEPVPVLVPPVAVPLLAEALLAPAVLVVAPAPFVVLVPEAVVFAVVAAVAVVESDVLPPLCAVLELVVPAVSAVVPGAADPDSPPQPASAIVTLPNNAGQAIRPDPTQRLAFLMRPPSVSSLPVRADEGINQEVARGRRNRGCWLFSRGSATAPATPLS